MDFLGWGGGDRLRSVVGLGSGEDSPSVRTAAVDVGKRVQEVVVSSPSETEQVRLLVSAMAGGDGGDVDDPRTDDGLLVLDRFGELVAEGDEFLDVGRAQVAAAENVPHFSHALEPVVEAKKLDPDVGSAQTLGREILPHVDDLGLPLVALLVEGGVKIPLAETLPLVQNVGIVVHHKPEGLDLRLAPDRRGHFPDPLSDEVLGALIRWHQCYLYLNVII